MGESLVRFLRRYVAVERHARINPVSLERLYLYANARSDNVIESKYIVETTIVLHALYDFENTQIVVLAIKRIPDTDGDRYIATEILRIPWDRTRLYKFSNLRASVDISASELSRLARQCVVETTFDQLRSAANDIINVSALRRAIVAVSVLKSRIVRYTFRSGDENEENVDIPLPVGVYARVSASSPLKVDMFRDGPCVTQDTVTDKGFSVTPVLYGHYVTYYGQRIANEWNSEVPAFDDPSYRDTLPHLAWWCARSNDEAPELYSLK